MNNLKYLKYLIKHKYYVTRECFRRGLYWRGLVHDLSKFLPSEWIPYKNYFYGDYKPYSEFSSGEKFDHPDCWERSKECIELHFDYAWLHHQHSNKHHWQYWILQNDDGSKKALEMPTIYKIEMVCDWIGAGMAIHGKNEALDWYEKNAHKMILHKETRWSVENLLGKKT